MANRFFLMQFIRKNIFCYCVEEKIEINKNILMSLRIRLRCQFGGIVDTVNSAIESDTLLLKVRIKNRLNIMKMYHF